MKAKIKAASNGNYREKIIEVNSIDEAIKRIQTDKELVRSLIYYKTSWLTDELTVSSFIIYTNFNNPDWDIEIIIYDDYWE